MEADLVLGPVSATASASITSLVKTIIGAGILGLPFAFSTTGLLVGMGLLVLAGAAQLFALHVLSIVVVQARAEGVTPSFQSLALDTFGSRGGATAVEAIICVHCFGTATSYLIVAGDLCPQLAQYLLAGEPDGWLEALLQDRRFWILLVAFCVELPLFWQRTLDALKTTSFIGNAAVLVVAGLTAAFTVGVLHVPTTPPIEPVSWLPPAADDSSPSYATRIGVLGVYVFAFSCTMNLPQVT
jgi:amino acid permease